MNPKTQVRLVYYGLVAIGGLLTPGSATAANHTFSERLELVRATLAPARLPPKSITLGVSRSKSAISETEKLAQWSQSWSQWSRSEYSRSPG
jgi:hypothetical protein